MGGQALAMVPYRSCVELLAFAFGDTILDVAQVDAYAPSYRIGEGEGVRVPVSGDGLPDPAGFTLVWAGAGGFWLGFCAGMREQLVAEGRAVLAADESHHVLLEARETIWVEHQSIRFRIRLVPREIIRASRWTIDWGYLGSLTGSAIVVLLFLLLARAQPAPIVDEDEHRAVLARLLELEPVPPEPIPGPPSETAQRLDLGRVDRGAASTPLLPPPDPRPRSSTREQPLWAPASPAQAVGRLGRTYDPIEAARHAGIFGVLGERRFTGERVFDPEIDDAQLWATTADVGQTWMDGFDRRVGRHEVGLIGTGSYGLIGHRPGEGVVGWGSYGPMRGVSDWRHRSEESRELEALCRGECRRSVRPPTTIVRLGQVLVQGALDQDVARRIIRAHVTDIRRCFDETITERTAELAGDVEFSLVRGKVGAIVMDPAFPSALGECMKRSIRRWQFPVGSSQATDMVTVSLRLSR
jgi:hypothetical protein